MKFRDLMSVSLKNVLRNRKKTALSALSVAIGVASLLLISAVGKGVNQTAEEELARLGIDGLSVRLEDADDQSIPAAAAEGIERHVPGVVSAMPFKIKYGYARLLHEESEALLWGVDAKMIETMDLRLLHGRGIGREDVSANARAAVLDEEYAKKVYRRANIVGKTLRICIENTWEDYEIVGVIASQTKSVNSMLGADIGVFVYLPYTVMNESSGEYGVDQIAVRCAEEADPAILAAAIERFMSVSYPTEGTYTAENITAYLARVKGIVRLIGLLVTAIGGISLIVACVGVMNSMFAGIEERRREIGIYLAVGAIPRDIVGNVLLESVFTCISGGIAGCIIALAASEAVKVLLEVPCRSGIGEAAASLTVSVFCGIVSGLIPAVKAAHMDPMKALNHI